MKFGIFSRDPQKRRFFWERIGVYKRKSGANKHQGCFWIHANAIGEVGACDKLIALLKKRHPSKRILLTTYNFSADMVAHQKEIADDVVFFPYDIPFIIKRCFKHFNPEAVIIIESDIWPNFVILCKNEKIPLAVVSGIFSQEQSRSINLRHLYNYSFRLPPEVLSTIDCFCMQTADDAQRLRKEIPWHRNISVTGNLKFGVTNSEFTEENRIFYCGVFNIQPGDHVFVAGNIHREEFKIVIDAFKRVARAMPEAVFILAPRFIEDVTALEVILNSNNISFVKRSFADAKRRTREKVVILDTMGELSKVYTVARLAFIGGSLVYFGEIFGGHNIVEPALVGVPVIFGPFMHNFRKIADIFLDKRIAIEVRDADGLARNIVEILPQEERRQYISKITEDAIKDNADVAEKSLACIEPSLFKDRVF